MSRCLSDLVSLDRADYALDPEITASLQLKTDVARRTESRAEFGYDVASPADPAQTTSNVKVAEIERRKTSSRPEKHLERSDRKYGWYTIAKNSILHETIASSSRRTRPSRALQALPLPTWRSASRLCGQDERGRCSASVFYLQVIASLDVR